MMHIFLSRDILVAKWIMHLCTYFCVLISRHKNIIKSHSILSSLTFVCVFVSGAIHKATGNVCRDESWNGIYAETCSLSSFPGIIKTKSTTPNGHVRRCRLLPPLQHPPNVALHMITVLFTLCKLELGMLKMWKSWLNYGVLVPLYLWIHLYLWKHM